MAASDLICKVSFVGCAATKGVEAIKGAASGVGDAVNTAKGIADFWSDPAGNLFNMLQDGAKSLSDTVMPAITKATLPDLTADWFINAYKVSFALAIFVMVALIIPQVVRTARGQQSGRDLAESLGLYAPLFLIGAAFGPLLGSFLVKFFGALTDSRCRGESTRRRKRSWTSSRRCSTRKTTGRASRAARSSGRC